MSTHRKQPPVAPADVVDRLLWRDAQQILGRHNGPDAAGSCNWCGRSWPCEPRRLAERAESAARRPWNESWTARHDMYSVRTMPVLRVERGERSIGGWHRTNTGLFE